MIFHGFGVSTLAGRPEDCRQRGPPIWALFSHKWDQTDLDIGVALANQLFPEIGVQREQSVTGQITGVRTEHRGADALAKDKFSCTPLQVGENYAKGVFHYGKVPDNGAALLGLLPY